jgi:hypothetical protein
MSRITNPGLVTTLVFTLAACTSSSDSSSGNATVVTDTLGWTFDVTCGNGLCTLACRDTDIVPKSCANGSGTDAFILVADPLLSIYAVRVPSSGQVQLSAANPSRPVACAIDADCLVSGLVAPGVAYACTNGLCQCTSEACATADGKPLTYDVLTLCQADLDWPARCPYITSQPFASRISEVASLCGSMDTCAKVPADCRQLTPVVSADGGAQSTVPVALDGGALDTP